MKVEIEELLRENNIHGYCAKFLDHDDYAGLVKWLIDFAKEESCGDTRAYDEGYDEGKAETIEAIISKIRYSSRLEDGIIEMIEDI